MLTQKSFFQFFLITLIAITSFSCGSQRHFTTLNDNTKIDKRLVGTWEGSEEDTQFIGMSKSWTMTRKADGTFTLDFRVSQNGQTRTVIETGRWWTQDGHFHEFHDVSGATDVYDYQILNATQVKFTSCALTASRDELAPDTVEFIDTKVSTK